MRDVPLRNWGEGLQDSVWMAFAIIDYCDRVLVSTGPYAQTLHLGRFPLQTRLHNAEDFNFGAGLPTVNRTELS